MTYDTHQILPFFGSSVVNGRGTANSTIFGESIPPHPWNTRYPITVRNCGDHDRRQDWKPEQNLLQNRQKMGEILVRFHRVTYLLPGEWDVKLLEQIIRLLVLKSRIKSITHA